LEGVGCSECNLIGDKGIGDFVNSDRGDAEAEETRIVADQVPLEGTETKIVLVLELLEFRMEDAQRRTDDGQDAAYPVVRQALEQGSAADHSGGPE
jgi:hypothetical protein